jgi:hypothetical protein
VRELLDMEYEMRCHEEIISEISEQIASEDLVASPAPRTRSVHSDSTSQDDALERYERNVKVRVNDYRKKTSRQKYGKSEEYGHFKQVQYVCAFCSLSVAQCAEFSARKYAILIRQCLRLRRAFQKVRMLWLSISMTMSTDDPLRVRRRQ